MKVAILGDINGNLSVVMRGFGWQVESDAEVDGLDAVLVLGGPLPASGPVPLLQLVERVCDVSPPAEDFLCLLLKDEAELAARIRRLQLRRQAVIRWIHELRTPLNAAQGYAEMIAEDASGETARYATHVRTATGQLEALLKKLRSTSV